MATKNTIFPACEVQFPANLGQRTATFYLAAEEYVAQNWPADRYLFSWILPPTVVMGRNQVAHQEFDLDYCHAANIDVVRRKSGGGAVFADDRNIMWSLVTGAGDVDTLFRAYAEAVADALTQIGAPAEATGRNDIVLADGGKVCGNAFYHLAGRNIVHGTMLYDTNMEAMQRALRPDPDKLKAKGVQSVRRRISLLKDHIDCGTEGLRQRLTKLLTDRCIGLTDADVAAIENIERGYRETSFLYGHIKSADECLRGRIEGCGTLEIRFSLDGSRVADVQLGGDFFELANAAEAFKKAFTNIPFTAGNLQQQARKHHLHESLRGLSEEALQQLLGRL